MFHRHTIEGVNEGQVRMVEHPPPSVRQLVLGDPMLAQAEVDHLPHQPTTRRELRLDDQRPEVVRGEPREPFGDLAERQVGDRQPLLAGQGVALHDAINTGIFTVLQVVDMSIFTVLQVDTGGLHRLAGRRSCSAPMEGGKGLLSQASELSAVPGAEPDFFEEVLRRILAGQREEERFAHDGL